MIGIAAAAAVGAAGWNPPVSVAPDASTIAVDQGTPRVASPWRPGRSALGVHVYWVNSPADSDEVVRLKARRLLDHVVGMEANAIAVSFPFFTDSITSSSVYADHRTPPPARLGILIEEARRSGLRTTFGPLLDQTNLGDPHSDGWRGTLAPTDRDDWFRSYREFLTPYLVLAQGLAVDTVVVGVELNTLQGDPRWAPLVAHASGLFDGEITYSANWDAYAGAVTGVPVDDVGINAYPTLDLDRDATEEVMTEAWRRWLDRIAAGRTTDLVLAEVGAPAESTMLANPAIYHTPGSALDEGIQRRWFAAACRAAGERPVAGLYWWKIGFDVDPALADPDGDLHDSFLGREAESAIRECFTAWGAAQ